MNDLILEIQINRTKTIVYYFSIYSAFLKLILSLVHVVYMKVNPSEISCAVSNLFQQLRVIFG